MARFVAGFAVGFTSVWQLTLVTLAVVPLIAVAGGAYAVTMIGLTSKSQKAYAKAGEIAEQVTLCLDPIYGTFPSLQGEYVEAAKQVCKQ